MRKILGLALLIGLAGTAFGQMNVDQHDGSTDYTSRGISGGNDGWAFNRYAIDSQGGGIGTSGITGWATVMQDQNCATLENWQFALFDQLTVDANGPIPPGDVRSVPDANNVIASGALFTSPAGGNTPCAWVFTNTFTTPLPGGQLNDIFTATWLPQNAAWTADGSSSHISIQGQGTNQEFPNQTPNALTRMEIDQEYGINMLGGPYDPVAGTGPIQGTESFPGSPRLWINRLRYEHTTRAGAYDTTGTIFATVTTHTPQNWGWAGRYPDLINASGLTARADDLIWRDQHTTLGGATTQGQILLANGLARATVGAPLPIPGVGVLELDPLDALFSVTMAGGLPGLVVPGAAVGTQDYALLTGIQAMGGGIAQMLQNAQVNFYCQALRLDLASGTISLGALDSASLRL